MAKIDLDAARAARREAAGEAPVLTVGKKDYPLAVELPASLISDMAIIAGAPESGATSEQQAQVMVALERVAAAMLGDAWDKVRPQLSVDDLMTMLEQVAPVYGFESPGESSASAASS